MAKVSAEDNLGIQWQGTRSTIGTIHNMSVTPWNHIAPTWHQGKKKWIVMGGLGDGTIHKTLRDAKQHVESLYRRSQ